jgi:large conductance mechanosensitive channel
MLKEFKEFISKGNVMDMAIGVIIGAAFGSIVTSLTNNILMPLIGMLIGGIDFSNLVLKIGDATLNYGLFIQSVLDFLIIAYCAFLLTKTANKIRKKKEVVKEVMPTKEEKLLTEIRDLLKKKSK